MKRAGGNPLATVGVTGCRTMQRTYHPEPEFQAKDLALPRRFRTSVSRPFSARFKSVDGRRRVFVGAPLVGPPTKLYSVAC
jgi:hypothetical protein